jgi:hypothetical protein
MNSIEISNQALDRLFNPANSALLDKIYSEVNSMNFEGPNVNEYFASIEARYEQAFDLSPAFASCEILSEAPILITQYAIECVDLDRYERNRKVESELITAQPIKKNTAPEKIRGFFFRLAT